MGSVDVNAIMEILDAGRGWPGDRLNEIRTLCEQAPGDEVAGDAPEPSMARHTNAEGQVERTAPEPVEEGAVAATHNDGVGHG